MFAQIPSNEHKQIIAELYAVSNRTVDDLPVFIAGCRIIGLYGLVERRLDVGAKSRQTSLRSGQTPFSLVILRILFGARVRTRQ